LKSEYPVVPELFTTPSHFNLEIAKPFVLVCKGTSFYYKKILVKVLLVVVMTSIPAVIE
jgi:hypothetical protein